MKIQFIIATLIVGATVLQAQDQPQMGSQNTMAMPPPAESPIQLSLTPAIALQPRTTTIDGLSLNIWGENPQHGVALGLVNGSTGESAGFSWGIVNYDDSYEGVQWGVVNVSRENFVGWQRGFVNVARGTFTGFQDGLVNVSDSAQGFQLGVVNYAQQLNGLQIGLVNVAVNNPWFTEFPSKLAKGFPIVNWSF